MYQIMWKSSEQIPAQINNEDTRTTSIEKNKFLHILPVGKMSSDLTKSYESAYCVQIKPFFPNATFLYPLETSENPKVFWCFQGVEKGCLGDKWVKFCGRHQNHGNWRRLDVFIIVGFEHIQYNNIVFLLLAWNMHLSSGLQLSRRCRFRSLSRGVFIVKNFFSI